MSRGDRAAALVAERELDLLPGLEPRQRPLPERVHRHERRLPHRGRARIFITDFRYVERAKYEVPDFELVRGSRTCSSRSRRSSGNRRVMPRELASTTRT